MGDITDTVGTDAPEPHDMPGNASQTNESSKASIEVLKEAKPSQNLNINSTDSSLETAHLSAPLIKTKSKSASPIEPDESTTDISPDAAPAKAKKSERNVIQIKVKESTNKSQIFSTATSNDSTIFSVGGKPSKTVQTKNAQDNQTEVIENVSSQIRNPVTGFGVSSNDEFKNKPPQRKDGNPVLGVGYKDKETSSSRRVPPGGYSNGIW